MVRIKYCGGIPCASNRALCNAKPCNGTFTIFTMLLYTNIVRDFMFKLFYTHFAATFIDDYHHSAIC